LIEIKIEKKQQADFLDTAPDPAKLPSTRNKNKKISGRRQYRRFFNVMII
jgi:hypothetical protein